MHSFMAFFTACSSWAIFQALSGIFPIDIYYFLLLLKTKHTFKWVLCSVLLFSHYESCDSKRNHWITIFFFYRKNRQTQKTKVQKNLKKKINAVTWNENTVAFIINLKKKQRKHNDDKLVTGFSNIILCIYDAPIKMTEDHGHWILCGSLDLATFSHTINKSSAVAIIEPSN